MPLWGTLILWELHSQPFQFYDLLKHGEFALYAAAFLAPSLQQIASNIKDTKYVLGAGTLLIVVTGLLVAVLIYSGVQPPQEVNPARLKHWSLILLPASVLFSVFVTLVEHQMSQPDLAAAESDALADLSSRLEGKLPPPSEALQDPVEQEGPAEPSERDLEKAFREETGSGEAEAETERTARGGDHA